MRTNREHVTMDGNEAKLLDRYEAQFGETPPIDSILRNVKQDDSNNEVDSTPTMKSLRQAAASNSTIFWIALSAR